MSIVQLSSTQNYICPMHNEVRQSKPGRCPICGMYLEEIKNTQVIGDNIELNLMKWRFIVSSICAVILVILMIYHHFLEMNVIIMDFIQLAIATLVVIWAGKPLITQGLLSLKNRSFNMYTLLMIGIIIPYIYSLIIVFMPNIHIVSGVYFETATMVTTFALLGQLLELKANKQTTASMNELLSFLPKMVHLIEETETIDIPVEKVKIGDILRIKPGEQIPVDGVIIEGSGAIDESLLTGEGVPRTKQEGDKIIAGTLNYNGSFVMKVEQVGEGTIFAHIVNIVAKARSTKAHIQLIVDKASAYFVPAVIVIAICTALLWIKFGDEQRLSYAFMNSIAVLIVACPCALGLATPIAITVAINKAALQGILIKNAQSMETLAKATDIVLDKTGTVTEGKPRVVDIIPINDFSPNKLIQFAASGEQASEHPLAAAIIFELQARKLEMFDIKDFQSITGKGVKAKINNDEVIIGNMAMLKRYDINVQYQADKINVLLQPGNTLVFIAINSIFAGIIVVADSLKASTKQAISILNKNKLQITILSGDNKDTVQSVAKELNISQAFAELLPGDKIDHIKTLQQTGKIVVMVGDGINDAPALAQAHVGIALSSGADLAINSGDVTLFKGDLMNLPRVLALSRITMNNIKQNLIFAFAYNIIGILLATGIFLPHFGISLSPTIASLAMALSSASVIFNSLRIRNVQL